MQVQHRLLSKELQSDNTLHVITVISNPVQYSSRIRLYEQFAKDMAVHKNAHLVTVELAFGDRKFEVTSSSNPDHVQLRTSSELWAKENLINVGIRRLPHYWKYVAWVDADIKFINPDIISDTLHQLQHHPIVQMFEDAVDLGPRNNVLQHHTSFGKLYVLGAPKFWNSSASAYYQSVKAPYWHSGYAWAMRRDLYENVGGLIDKAIVGSSDHHMALALIGEAKYSLPKGLHPNYNRMVYDWQDRALRATNHDLGYVAGSILHHWHGPKKRRFYTTRWTILKDSQYDPNIDVKYSASGVLELTGNKPKLRDDLRRYFRSRSEDSMEED